MITLAQADILIGIFSTIFALSLLSSFTAALFFDKYRQSLAIITGIMTALLLVILGIALAAPFIFTT